MLRNDRKAGEIMATEKKLDCVILGLLSHEELTGYEIKKRMDTALKYFWGQVMAAYILH